jgi:hypothetical protein
MYINFRNIKTTAEVENNGKSNFSWKVKIIYYNNLWKNNGNDY